MPRRTTLIVAGVGLAFACSGALAELPTSRPHQAIDHSLLCGLLQTKREFHRAIDHCNAVLSAAPKDVDALSNRGAAYLQLGSLEMALADFNAAIAISPEDGKNFFNRALVHSAMRQHLLAIADYDTAIRLIPNLAIAYNNRAYEFERIGERDKSIADYRKALSIDGNLRGVVIQNLRRLGVAP